MDEERKKKREEKKKITLSGSSIHQNIFTLPFSIKRAVSPVFSKNREEKDKEKRGKRGRKYNCMAAVYAGSPNYFLVLHFFVAKCCKYSVFEGLGKIKKWREKEEKRRCAVCRSSD